MKHINIFKNIILFFFAILFTSQTKAQTETKNVSITASGSGITLEDAQQAALRSATEQAFGVFISSKIEMLNNKIIADEMASVTSGNIKSFEILNKAQLPDGRWAVTLKTIVSIDKLSSFVQAKGGQVDFKGNMFALNIKQQLANEDGEFRVVYEMIGLLHNIMQTSFDYDIESSNPVSLDGGNTNWKLTSKVNVKANKNMDFCANYMINTLNGISLTKSDLENYKSLNKIYFPVEVRYKGTTYSFFLRNQLSIKALTHFDKNWDYYSYLFSFFSNENEYYGEQFDRSNKFGSPSRSYEYYKSIKLFFSSEGEKYRTFTRIDEMKLSEIEKFTGYSVKPRGIISEFKNGGYVIREKYNGGYKIGMGVNKNMIVNQLLLGYPAVLSGIEIGDKILEINDVEFKGIEQIALFISNGDKIYFKVLNSNGDIKKIKIRPMYLKPHDGLVISMLDFPTSNCNYGYTLDEANKVCENLELNGYKDWRLPSIEELDVIYVFCFRSGNPYFNLYPNRYWSNTSKNIYIDQWPEMINKINNGEFNERTDSKNYWLINFETLSSEYYNRFDKIPTFNKVNFIPVRTF